MSYIWYSGLGACTVILIGLVTSLVVSRDVETLDRRLLSPCLHTIYQVTHSQSASKTNPEVNAIVNNNAIDQGKGPFNSPLT